MKSCLKISEIFRNLLGDSTAHAIPRIVKSNGFILKAIWTLGFLISFAVCCISLYRIALDYLNYEFITLYQLVSEMPAEFPVVTICNLNPFQTEQAQTIISSFNLNKFDATSLKVLILNKLYASNDTVRKSISLPLNLSLISCRINAMPCESNEFYSFFSPVYGNCYQLNTGKDMFGKQIPLNKISQTGNRFGLQLELFLGNVSQIPYFIKKAGFHVMITNQTIKPSIEEGLDIAPGTETNIKIDRTHLTQLGQPYNECIPNPTIDTFDSYLYKVLMNNNRTYRQRDCFFLCIQEKVIGSCGCYANIMDKLYSDTPCTSESQMRCSTGIFRNVSNNGLRELCSSRCPLECNSVSYSITVSTSQYPCLEYANYLRNNSLIRSFFTKNEPSVDEIKNSVLSLNVYYDELSYTLISQHPKYEIFDLISNIGGVMGLFLGISFLSFIEIVEILIEILSLFLKKSNKTNSLF